MSYQNQAARRVLPTDTTTVTVGAAASTAEIDLSSYNDTILLFQARTGDIHIVAGAEGATVTATTSHIKIPLSSSGVEFTPVAGRNRIRCIASATGCTLVYAPTSL